MPTFTKKGALTGTDTVDTVEINLKLPIKMTYTVKATGDGENELRVRLQRMAIAVWARVDDFDLNPGKSKTKTFESDLDTSNPLDGKEQLIRFKFSRKILTKELEWELSYTLD